MNRNLLPWLAVLALFVAGAVALAGDKADPTPPPYILPPAPTPPVPPPPPNTPVNIVAGKPYVIRLNAASVIVSPAGVVKLCTKPEPVVLVDAEGNDTTYSGDKSVCIVSAKAQGQCELVLVSTADGAELARVQVVVGSAPTPPPGPTPPTPPTNPLTATLQAAYTADGANDAKDVAFLASLYTQAAPLAKNQTGWKTNADAAAWLKGIEGNYFQSDATLAKLRAALSAELTAALPPAGAVDANAVAAELAKVGNALGGVR